MAAFLDTQHFTGKTAVAADALTNAATAFTVNARKLSALAWGTAP